MKFREISLTQSSINNGRIYFPSTDIGFFTAATFSDRQTNCHKGMYVKFRAGSYQIESPIRIYSGKRLSPRRSFAPYLKSIGARVGDRLRVTQTGEGEYLIEHLAA